MESGKKINTNLIKRSSSKCIISLVISALVSASAWAANPALHYVGPRCGFANQLVVGYKDGAGYANIDSTTASTASNFSVTDITTSSHSAETISSAAYFSSQRATLLTLGASMGNLTAYSVTVSGVQDVDTNTMASTSDYVYYSSTETGIVGALWDESDSLSGTPSLAHATTINEDLSSETSGGLFSGLFALLEALTCSLLTCPDTKLSARWTGFVYPSTTGTHTFEADYNERARLWVDDPRNSTADTVINQWTATLSSTHSDATATADVSLTASTYYPITYEWAWRGNKDDSGRVVLNWTPPSSSKVVLPAANFKTCITASFETLDYFTVSAPASASACGSAVVEVTAVGTENNPMDSYVGTITLSTSSGHGDWSTSAGAGTLTNGTADDGIATYTFHEVDAGVVSFELTNRHADVTTVTVNDSSEGVSETSSAITFEKNGIEINEASASDWDVVVGRDHDFEVEYLVLTPGDVECETADVSGVVGLKFWRTVGGGNPGGAAAPTISNDTDTENLSASSGSPTSLNVTISSGIGSFTLGTSDVGEFDLNVMDDSSGFFVDGGGSPITVSGADTRGTTISVRPFGILLSATDNPGATDASGAAYKKAGENFTVQVTGVAYDASEDANNDGLPDGHDDSDPDTGVDLSDNAVVTSFGGEGESITLSANLLEPSGGNEGTLSGSLGVFAAGSASGSFNYDEVGIIEITAESDANYLTSNVQLMGKSSHVGRFTPDHFDISHNTPGLTDAWLDIAPGDGVNDWDCEFTYFGQPFGFDFDPEVTFMALNSSDVVTQNYVGDFNKYVGATGTLVDDGLPIASNAVLTAPGAGFSVLDDEGDGFDDPGVFMLQITGYDDFPYGFSYTKPLVETNEVVFDASFHMEYTSAELQDSDGVCYDTGGGCVGYAMADDSIVGTTLYYGRLVVDSNYGSGASDLNMVFRTEAWQLVGGAYRFSTLTSDSNLCAGTDGIAVTMTGYSDELGAGETTATVGPLTNGVGQLNLTAPGVDNYGQVQVTVNVPSFLQYDFDGDLIPDDPSAMATFGVFGSDTATNQFFRKESYR